MKPILVVVAGATAVGKTHFAIQLAKHFNSVVISADSRQFYREISIGTAKPRNDELENIPHYFLGNLSIHDYYNVSMYEQDVLQLFKNSLQQPVVFLSGGSGLYIDAVCNGIDDMPDFDPELRNQLIELANNEGIEAIRMMLKNVAPESWLTVDLKNKNRMIRAIEMKMLTGKDLSQFHQKPKADRPFKILKIVLDMPREQLYNRINERVNIMMKMGLLDEARSVYPLRHVNALNTVGYKELFSHFDGNITVEEAIDLIQRNTRKFARRQLTWFRKYDDAVWLNPSQISEAIELINKNKDNLL